MTASRDPHFSFELFPPRTPPGWAKLPALINELARVKPSFFSVTYGAGGSDQNGTYDTLIKVVEQTGIEAAPHLTCVGSTRANIAALLQQYRDAGVKRIVALRGDLPATAMSSAARGEFRFANELIEFIRDAHGDAFALEVAAYPEIHPQATSPEADFDAFVRKVQAGADGAVTQYFYNADAYFDFAERCDRAGLKVPIVPGIMPIVNFYNLVRFSDMCGAEIPRWVAQRMQAYGDDAESIREFGADVVARLCSRLIEGGAPGLHFYTLNLSKPTLTVLARIA